MDPVEYVRSCSSPLAPESTGVEPRLRALEGIRAVIFDIYGTLIISAAGDISLVSEKASEQGMVAALNALGAENASSLTSVALREYRSEIKEQQEKKRAEETEFPEVEIRDVWRAVASRSGLRPDSVEEAALIYECAVNPCWEMPGSRELIRSLHENDFLLGIISNAQFYTESVVEGVSGVLISGEEFEQDLSVFSFREGQGKPSQQLFHKVASAAGKRGVKPGEILYIGNDFLKDIEPARAVGFSTALFAGDQRSLRTGGLTVDEACRVPDVVLTELIQLLEVLRLSS